MLGLEEGVDQCKILVCSMCKTSGASVGCTKHKCKEGVHLGCAVGGREGGVFMKRGWMLGVLGIGSK